MLGFALEGFAVLSVRQTGLLNRTMGTFFAGHLEFRTATPLYSVFDSEPCILYNHHFKQMFIVCIFQSTLRDYCQILGLNLVTVSILKTPAPFTCPGMEDALRSSQTTDDFLVDFSLKRKTSMK